MPSEGTASTRARSDFVTVVAWIFIVCSAFIVLISVAQGAMFMFVFNSPHFAESMRQARSSFAEMPEPMQYFFAHPLDFFALFWILAVLNLVASIGLLLRKNWARLIFVGLMFFAIFWNLGGVVLQQTFFASFPKMIPNCPPEFAKSFQDEFAYIQVFGVIYALGFSLLFGWIARRLMSAPVRAEFSGP